jgi:dUTP pyrophosphatase
MARFEIVSKYEGRNLPLPQRATANSAGYDFVVAEDIIIRPFDYYISEIREKAYADNPNIDFYGFNSLFSLDDMSNLTKQLNARPTLVPTGIKCQLAPNQYLELSVRSSTPLKDWLILANGVGIIDADYYNNPDNEGHIFFQVINLSPFAIELAKGDKIGQGIIRTYETVDDDCAEGERNGGFGSTNE